MNHADRIDSTINGIYHAFEHPHDHPAESGLDAIDQWIAALDGLGGSTLTGIQNELRTLRGHIERNDRAAIASSLQLLGETTSRTAHDLHDGTGDHLRHLGQTLITAAGNLKMS